MNKIGLIIRREYLTRVRNKTFLLSTFLLPVMIVLLISSAGFLAIKGKTTHRIAVVDENGYFKDYLKSDSGIAFNFSPGIDSLNYSAKNCSAVLIIPELKEGEKTVYRLKYKKQLGLGDISDLERRISSAITDHFIYTKTNVSRSRLDSLRAAANEMAELKTFPDEGKNVKASSQGFAYGVGYACGFLIYILTFIYGAAVMRGVMEEKTSRIAEVIVSSVKPFPLMMGKIIGIGAVGLTQFLLWVVLIVLVAGVGQAFIPHDVLQEVNNLQQANSMTMGSAVQASEAAQKIFRIRQMIGGANWLLIVTCFIYYFLGGYLFYASLFAAVGSVVNEDPQEAQSLLLPISMPIVFSFIIMSIAAQDPGGSLSVWASIIPLSSPIVMMARIPYGVPGGVPYWQLLLSMALLAGGFLFTTWLAGKIYRTGILMYGKKPNWKTMWSWAFRRE
ncbi:MAG TPA: ABC transporter permease [Puia sp.]|nr:ABC transporter permease [Puia sp.]